MIGISRSNLLLLLAVASCIAAVQAGPRVGGLGESKLADDEVRNIIESVRETIQQQYPEPFDRVEPVSYKTQVVAGKNYFVKAIFHERDGDKIVAHLRIYKGFRGEAELTAMKLKVKHEDPIEWFQ